MKPPHTRPPDDRDTASRKENWHCEHLTEVVADVLMVPKWLWTVTYGPPIRHGIGLPYLCKHTLLELTVERFPARQPPENIPGATTAASDLE
jgi:hypothetical protein